MPQYRITFPLLLFLLLGDGKERESYLLVCTEVHACVHVPEVDMTLKVSLNRAPSLLCHTRSLIGPAGTRSLAVL